MIVLGLLLILLAAGVGVVTTTAATSQSATTRVAMLGLQRDAYLIELVVAGALTVLLFALGWAAISVALRRRARHRREDRASERLAEVERDAEKRRLDQERRFEEAGRRDEDLSRREDELSRREATLLEREERLGARGREEARPPVGDTERVSPSVADVVAGRADGSVAEGTATWREDSTGPAHRDATRPVDSRDAAGGTPRRDERR